MKPLHLAIAAAVLLAAVSPRARAETMVIDIKTFQFTPKEITVKVGDTVRWVNADGIAHSATAASFDTGLFKKGEQREITFSKAGSFAYHCERHKSMKGTVTVEAR